MLERFVITVLVVLAIQATWRCLTAKRAITKKDIPTLLIGTDDSWKRRMDRTYGPDWESIT